MSCLLPAVRPTDAQAIEKLMLLLILLALEP